MRRFRGLAATLASVPITLFGLVLITFLIGRVVPIDPVLAIIGDRAPADVVARTRLELGLDRPLPEQFLRYAGQLVQGDFGRSVMSGNRVTQDIARFFPATLELATTALLLAVLLGVPLGVWAAVRQGRWVDMAIRVVCLSRALRAGVCVGADGAAGVLREAAVAAGAGAAGDHVRRHGGRSGRGCCWWMRRWPGSGTRCGTGVRHLALPALVLGLSNLAYIARMTRGFMLDALRGE